MFPSKWQVFWQKKVISISHKTQVFLQKCNILNLNVLWKRKVNQTNNVLIRAKEEAPPTEFHFSFWKGLHRESIEKLLKHKEKVPHETRQKPLWWREWLKRHLSRNSSGCWIASTMVDDSVFWSLIHCTKVSLERLKVWKFKWHQFC